MSDPLSVAAGVAGVVVAAAQISSLLIKFTKSTIAAPQQAKVVLTEVSDIGGILSHLQSFLLGLDLPDRSRVSLLKVEKVVTIVSGCVLTFSELEKLLDELKTDNWDILDRFKWARKESALAGYIQRLQNHKSSLSLVLDILNGFALFCLILLSACRLIPRRQTVAEAKESVDRLHTLVEKCYSEMSSRVQALEVLNMQQDEDTDSLATIHVPRPDVSSQEIMESGLGNFDFSDELQTSRVYRRTHAFRKSIISALTNSVHSLGWSFFSDLSVAEVSTVSVIDLAITKAEVFNSGRSLQTWSDQSDTVIKIHKDEDMDRKHELYEIADKPVQQVQQQSLPRNSSPYPRSQPSERRKTYSRWTEYFGEENCTSSAEYLDPASTLSPADPPKSLSTSQAQVISSWRFDQQAENDILWPCEGCGEV